MPRGRSGSTSTCVSPTGFAGSPSAGATGSPKLGAGVGLPATFQLENHFLTSAALSAGSMSPATMTTTFSGRYQREWKARTAS